VSMLAEFPHLLVRMENPNPHTYYNVSVCVSTGQIASDLTEFSQSSIKYIHSIQPKSDLHSIVIPCTWSSRHNNDDESLMISS
jgi:hypothetical protein